ncbi:MAG: ACT domain-containing protein [Vulcanibacillus sp.]
MNKKTEKDVYYLVSADILPEAILKTIEVKKILSNREAETVYEAVKRVGISKSAFYKYRDGVFSFNAMMKEKIVTISIDLKHKQGLLSNVLSKVAQYGGNILTINQTIPLKNYANIVLSIDTLNMNDELTNMLESIKLLDGVKEVQIIGRE